MNNSLLSIKKILILLFILAFVLSDFSEAMCSRISAASTYKKISSKKAVKSNYSDLYEIPDAPAASEEPVFSDEPLVSEEPMISDIPSVSEEPLITDEPVVSETPGSVDMPVVSETPQSNKNLFNLLDISLIYNKNNAVTFFYFSNKIDKSFFSFSNNSTSNKLTIIIKKCKNMVEDDIAITNSTIINNIKINSSSENISIEISYKKGYLYNEVFNGNSLSLTFEKKAYKLLIDLPHDTDTKNVIFEDQYKVKKFLITIPGNRKSFYNSDQLKRNTSRIKKISTKLTTNGNTKFTVDLRQLYAFKLERHNGYIIMNIDKPWKLYKNIILLDAGHGGKDRGAKKNGAVEKNINLSIIYTKLKNYFDSDNSDIKAYWTRHEDKFVNLLKRPKLSKTYSADMFISLHMNSSPRSAASGLEVYYSKKNNKKAKNGLKSRVFANMMNKDLKKYLKTKSRGVKQAGYVVIKNNSVPAILIELGFVSNKKEAKRLKSNSYQNKAAKAIYDSIKIIFKKYPGKR